jgi:hypothetical protein
MEGEERQPTSGVHAGDVYAIIDISMKSLGEGELPRTVDINSKSQRGHVSILTGREVN